MLLRTTRRRRANFPQPISGAKKMKEVIPNFVYRVKVKDDPRRILYVKGLGYWIVPMGVCISYNKKRNLMQFIITPQHCKQKTLSTPIHTKATFKQLIEQALDIMEGDIGLWSVGSPAVHTPIALYFSKITGFWGVNRPKALRNENTPTSTLCRDQRNAATIAEVLTEELRNKCHMTRKEASTFYSEVPEFGNQEQRSVKTVVPGFIQVVGKTRGGRNILHIEGLGYWIVPLYIAVGKTMDKNRFTVTYKGKAGKTTRLYSGECTKDRFLDFVHQAVHDVHKAHGLWYVSSPCVKTPMHVFKVYNNKYGFQVPTALQDELPRMLYGNSCEEAEQKAIECHQLLCDRYSVSLEEALTFHPTCPELR